MLVFFSNCCGCLVRVALICLLVQVGLLAQAPSRSSRLDPEFVAAHDAALRHARMWFPPDTAIKDADLGATALAGDGFREDADVECRFKVEGVGGATPKFTCVLPDGDDIKIKYGAANAEVYTEVLATRLLNTLGFPADRMYPVHRVRCFGCPADPFRQLQCLNDGVSKKRCFPDVDYKHSVDFPSAVVERSVSGRRIETEKERGWAWKELTKVDHSIGGASPAEVDAFRLLAVFLGHWDNKAKNQRLLCLGEAKRDEKAVAGSPSCERPVAMVQDVGATFGPEKLDLTRWSATPIWRDVARCVVSMRTLPYGGSTFPDAQISEAGRRHRRSPSVPCLTPSRGSFVAKARSRRSLLALEKPSGSAVYVQALVDNLPGQAPTDSFRFWAHPLVEELERIRERMPTPKLFGQPPPQSIL